MVIGRQLSIPCKDCALQRPCGEYLTERKPLLEGGGVSCFLSLVIPIHLNFLLKQEKTLASEFEAMELDKRQLYDDVARIIEMAEDLKDDRVDFDRKVNALEVTSVEENIFDDEDRRAMRRHNEEHGVKCPENIEYCGFLDEFNQDKIYFQELIEECRMCGLGK